jgi:hypothetical protein
MANIISNVKFWLIGVWKGYIGIRDYTCLKKMISNSDNFEIRILESVYEIELCNCKICIRDYENFEFGIRDSA